MNFGKHNSVHNELKKEEEEEGRKRGKKSRSEPDGEGLTGYAKESKLHPKAEGEPLQC